VCQILLYYTPPGRKRRTATGRSLSTGSAICEAEGLGAGSGRRAPPDDARYLYDENGAGCGRRLSGLGGETGGGRRGRAIRRDSIGSRRNMQRQGWGAIPGVGVWVWVGVVGRGGEGWSRWPGGW
jgi:hypothetical protein